MGTEFLSAFGKELVVAFAVPHVITLAGPEGQIFN
jgi:hypothetical protein